MVKRSGSFEGYSQIQILDLVLIASVPDLCSPLILFTFNFTFQAIKQQALKFLSAGVPIHGIGFQSHIKDANLDITAMKVSS